VAIDTAAPDPLTGDRLMAGTRRELPGWTVLLLRTASE
jgi:hypothetical protein